MKVHFRLKHLIFGLNKCLLYQILLWNHPSSHIFMFFRNKYVYSEFFFYTMQVQNFERLLRAIYAPQNFYCVHVDNKSQPSIKAAIEGIVSCFPNVFMVSQPVTVVYAAWPRVQADINCMADLYKVSAEWKYFINLCGQDFPLKTNLEMVRVLRSLKGANSMESENMPEGKKWRVSNAHEIVNGEIKVNLRTNVCVEAGINYLSCHIFIFFICFFF